MHRALGMHRVSRVFHAMSARWQQSRVVTAGRVGEEEVALAQNAAAMAKNEATLARKEVSEITVSCQMLQGLLQQACESCQQRIEAQQQVAWHRAQYAGGMGCSMQGARCLGVVRPS